MGQGALEEIGHLFGAGRDSGAGSGRYVFADLAELDAVTARWAQLREAIQEDRANLVQAAALIVPPAVDDVSHRQPRAMNASLREALDHNAAMLGYVESYVSKLTAAREQYSAEDTSNADRMRSVG